MKFSDFNFQPELLQALVEMGYEAPTPIQAQTIPLLLESKDVIGCARTGSGKTAAFALPVLNAIQGGQQNPQVLIIAPTRELAEQIRIAVDDYAKHLPVTCLAIYGGASSRLQEAQLSKGVDVVIATPGRLLDLLQRSVIRLYDVKYLILDEADRMLDMGFVPDIEEIMTFLPKKRQTLLFSATMPPAIKNLALSLTQNAEMIRIGIENAASDSVEQSVVLLSPKEKTDALMHIIQNHEIESMIVFARTKTGADQVAKTLIQNHVSATCIHSNRTQSQRQSALEAFRNGEYKVLVATDVAARGIDVSHISHVVNYDTPTHAEDYVHRVGRTGRAGAKGVAFTFTSSTEKKYLKDIEKLIGNSIDVVSLKQSDTPRSTQGEAAKTASKSSAKASPKATTKATAKADTKAATPKTTSKSTAKVIARPAPTSTPKTTDKPEKTKTQKASKKEGVTEAKASRQRTATPKQRDVKKDTPKKESLKKEVATRDSVQKTRKNKAESQEKTTALSPLARDRKTSRRRNDVVVSELPTPRYKPENDSNAFRKRQSYSLIQAEPRLSESYAFYRNPEDELDYLDFNPEERNRGEDPMKTFVPPRQQRSSRRSQSGSSRGNSRSSNNHRQHSRQRSR